MKRNVLFIIILCAFGQLKLIAQTSHKYTLQQCIDTALARNIQVKQNVLLTETAEVNWKQARANLLPDLN